MTDSYDYDLGYYEGWRNAVTFAIQMLLRGVHGNDLIQRMAVMRDEAHDELREHGEGDE